MAKSGSSWATWEPRLTKDGVEVDIDSNDTPELIQAKTRLALLKAQIAMLAATPIVEVEGFEDVDKDGRGVPAPPVPVEQLALVPPLKAPTPNLPKPRGSGRSTKRKRRLFAGPDPENDAYDFAARNLTAGPHGQGQAVVDVMQPPPPSLHTSSYAEAGPVYSGQVTAVDDQGRPLHTLHGLRITRELPSTMQKAQSPTIKSEPAASSASELRVKREGVASAAAPTADADPLGQAVPGSPRHNSLQPGAASLSQTGSITSTGISLLDHQAPSRLSQTSQADSLLLGSHAPPALSAIGGASTTGSVTGGLSVIGGGGGLTDQGQGGSRSSEQVGRVSQPPSRNLTGSAGGEGHFGVPAEGLSDGGEFAGLPGNASEREGGASSP